MHSKSSFISALAINIADATSIGSKVNINSHNEQTDACCYYFNSDTDMRILVIISPKNRVEFFFYLDDYFLTPLLKSKNVKHRVTLVISIRLTNLFSNYQAIIANTYRVDAASRMCLWNTLVLNNSSQQRQLVPDFYNLL